MSNNNEKRSSSRPVPVKAIHYLHHDDDDGGGAGLLTDICSSGNNVGSTQCLQSLQRQSPSHISRLSRKSPTTSLSSSSRRKSPDMRQSSPLISPDVSSSYRRSPDQRRISPDLGARTGGQITAGFMGLDSKRRVSPKLFPRPSASDFHSTNYNHRVPIYSHVPQGNASSTGDGYYHDERCSAFDVGSAYDGLNDDGHSSSHISRSIRGGGLRCSRIISSPKSRQVSSASSSFGPQNVGVGCQCNIHDDENVQSVGIHMQRLTTGFPEHKTDLSMHSGGGEDITSYGDSRNIRSTSWDAGAGATDIRVKRHPSPVRAYQQMKSRSQSTTPQDRTSPDVQHINFQEHGAANNSNSACAGAKSPSVISLALELSAKLHAKCELLRQSVDEIDMEIEDIRRRSFSAYAATTMHHNSYSPQRSGSCNGVVQQESVPCGNGGNPPPSSSLSRGFGMESLRVPGPDPIMMVRGVRASSNDITTDEASGAPCPSAGVAIGSNPDNHSKSPPQAYLFGSPMCNKSYLFAGFAPEGAEKVLLNKTRSVIGFDKGGGSYNEGTGLIASNNPHFSSSSIDGSRSFVAPRASIPNDDTSSESSAQQLGSMRSEDLDGNYVDMNQFLSPDRTKVANIFSPRSAFSPTSDMSQSVSDIQEDHKSSFFQALPFTGRLKMFSEPFSTSS